VSRVLGEALSGPGLETRYQPVVRMDDARVTGLEALARLTLPGQAVMAPDVFVPLIEGAGLIAEFTDAMAARAMSDLVAIGAAADGVQVLVNYPLDVLLVPDALARLEARRRAAGIAAGRLVIELTERHVVDDLPALRRAMESVLAGGYSLALDDIVPGLPGLHDLIGLPFAVLKLDRSVVHGAREPGAARDFVVFLATHAGNRGQTLIAEGIEDEATWNLMRELGANLAQGFLISHPMSSGEVPAWLASRPAAA